MTCVLNDGESVLAMVFRPEKREFCVLTPQRVSDPDIRLRGTRLALRAIVIIVVHYMKNEASGDSMKGGKAFAFVVRRACTVGSCLYRQK